MVYWVVCNGGERLGEEDFVVVLVYYVDYEELLLVFWGWVCGLLVDVLVGIY